jgi:ABC-type multidrug transport system fused ATPase/permease subunit
MLSINKILPLAAAVKSAMRSAAVLTATVDEISRGKEAENDEKTEITGEVQFKDVSFSYPLGSKKQVWCHNKS